MELKEKFNFLLRNFEFCKWVENKEDYYFNNNFYSREITRASPCIEEIFLTEWDWLGLGIEFLTEYKEIDIQINTNLFSLKDYLYDILKNKFEEL